ncbi:MAG: N-glycosylase/DNA lyase [Candidatus Thermoplasmatota archaeon]
MDALIKNIESIKNTSIKSIVNKKIEEFKIIGKGSNDDLFKELCFCILAANYNAEKTMTIQEKINNGFLQDDINELTDKLRKLGYRYPNTRARYITEARTYKEQLKDIINTKDREERRTWLVKNIKGIGYKESSHFLRNIGFNDYAIIDYHIIDLLVKHGITDKPKTITKKVYLKTEEKLRSIAERVNLTLAELDLYLWYIETGRIIK